MRSLVLGYLALALGASCGSGSSRSDSTSDGGSGGTSPTQVNLRITTAGNGFVRGAATDCRGNCTAQYVAGTQVHLVAVPDSGASFVSWAGACSGTGVCDLALDADREVSASFADAPPPPPDQRRLTVVVNGNGRVTSSPSGLDCDSSTCSATFAVGTSVTLTAAASNGFNFAGWGSDCSGGGDCTVLLSGDATVSASFISQPPPPPPPTQVHLSASVNGPGTVTGGGLECGDSSSTCDVMVASGTAVTLTASPSSGSRFAGWGGACSGTSTSCQLTPQSDVQVTAEFQSGILTLVPFDGTNLAKIALNSTHLFWVRFLHGGFSIWSVPKTGGEVVKIAGGTASAHVADDAHVYWTDGNEIFSAPAGGGQATSLVSSPSVGRLSLDEAGALYWAGTGGNLGGVFRMRDGVVTTLAKGEHPQGEVAVDATYVYFTAYDGQGSIRRIPRGGGAVEEVLSCGSDCYPLALRLDPQHVYFRSYMNGCQTRSGQVLAVSKADLSVRSLSDGNGGNDCSYDLDLDANASVVYWNWNGGSTPYGIFRANASGSGFAAIDTVNDFTWLTVRVDDQAIYYWKSGSIVRHPK